MQSALLTDLGAIDDNAQGAPVITFAELFGSIHICTNPITVNEPPVHVTVDGKCVPF